MNAKHFAAMLFLLPAFSFGQNIYWAFANAKQFTDYSSEIDFGENSKVLTSKFNKWKAINANDKFIGNVIQVVDKENWIYGSTRKVVTKFRFIKTENFTAYQNYMSNMAEAERLRRERDNIEGGILLGLVIKGGYAIGKSIVKGVKEMDFSGSSATSNSAAAEKSNSDGSIIDNAKEIIKEVKFIVTKSNVCPDGCIESYYLNIYADEKRKNWPDVVTLGKRNDGIWRTGCPGNLMGSTFIIDGGSFESAAKKYYSMYYRGEVLRFTFKQN